jgi:hypothetical protein
MNPEFSFIYFLSGMQEVRVSAMKWRTAREETREQVGIHAAEKTR